MGFFSKSVLVTLIAFWCFTSSAFTEELNHVTQTPSPAPYHHGHHHPHPPHAHHPHPHPHPHLSAKPPVMPPVYPPKFNKSLIAVRGFVYCKSCKSDAYNTLLGAKPVKGAVVRLLCKSKKKIVSETKTDEKGYFLLLGPKTVTKLGFRGCRVYLVKSKNAKCSKVSKLNRGDVGALLRPVKAKKESSVIVGKLTYGLFDVGPFAFEPVCPK